MFSFEKFKYEFNINVNYIAKLQIQLLTQILVNLYTNYWHILLRADKPKARISLGHVRRSTIYIYVNHIVNLIHLLRYYLSSLLIIGIHT